MDFLTFNDVTFTYPPVEGDIDENGVPIQERPIYEHFSASLPSGFVSVVGQNGCGKTTLMLLGCGRLKPDSGKVLLLGKDILSMPEAEKNLLASVIYQNMEFETEDKVSELLSQVYAAGNFHAKASGLKGGDLLSEVIDVFELEGVLEHTLTHLSKGEIQRVLLAFAILYGSASVFMDEPIFALEERQKETALAYLRDFVHKTGTTIYITMHEIDLTRKYADNVLLIHPNKDMSLGTPEEVLTNEELEKAYGIPASLLKHKESMTREQLMGESEIFMKGRQDSK
ncbi:MAG: ABC transporter ATP-binding protein [Treponema sp.]|nr:ABC transporter ATP-binding protein [Treponema sp.]